MPFTNPEDHEAWKLSYRERKNELQRKKRAENPETAKEYAKRAYQKKSPQVLMLEAAKFRSKKLGIECTITAEDIILPNFCPILGIPLEKNRGKGSKPNSYSLDRIDNSKGYVKGNIAVISHKANSLKRDMTVEELERLLQYCRNASA